MKKIIVAFIAGAIFATAGTAMANTIIEKVTASVRSDYKVELDGKSIELKNSPLAYNGSSYLPLKEFAQLLGKEVEFVEGTIMLKSIEEAPVEEVPEEKLPEEMLKLLDDHVEYQEEYDFKMNKLIFDRIVAVEGQSKTTDSEELAKYEKQIAGIDQQIADLKAKYPQYAPFFD
ncbi:hypothetical protein I6N90_03415 [Paenibacillus sp. GSMTC-2017]|uniref:hypothetical protein n=1 Tax=Paenibacillus sp. GSMTC-2017 TaxID=2794350 RepID=UPI0018D71D5C|nr:hypothetical protein [Paenibacillus sp. GSMTC-2017]MBH5316859.1 hypothetical protein [Paenibacillus sp. GSMTC-2017]